jgi:hypothetical protein
MLAHFASMDGLSALFFLEGHGYIAVCTQTHLLTFDVGDEIERDEVVMTFMTTLAAVLLGQLDPAAFDAVDCPEVNAIGADDFSMFLDLCDINHDNLPCYRRETHDRGVGCMPINPTRLSLLGNSLTLQQFKYFSRADHGN